MKLKLTLYTYARDGSTPEPLCFTRINFKMGTSKSYEGIKIIPTTKTKQLTKSTFPVSFLQTIKRNIFV